MSDHGLFATNCSSQQQYSLSTIRSILFLMMLTFLPSFLFIRLSAAQQRYTILYSSLELYDIILSFLQLHNGAHIEFIENTSHTLPKIEQPFP